MEYNSFITNARIFISNKKLSLKFVILNVIDSENKNR